MKIIAAAVVALLVLAFVGQKEQQTAEIVTCGAVSGGMTMTDKGITWAEDFGTWLHDLAEKPIGPDAVKATVKGVERVAWYWIRTWLLSAKGLPLDPSIIQVQQSAADARAAAEAQCTPCPTALPQDSSPLASLGAAPATGSPEEVVRQVAARYWPANEVDTAVAIAGAESTYRPTASLTYHGQHMRGLWQINDGAHADLIAGKNWADPSVNAYMAHQIWEDAGKKWTPWSTYNSGSYKRFLKPSAAAKLTAAVQPDGVYPDQQNPSNPSNSAPVNPQNVGCQSSGMPAVRVATWNSYYGPKHPGASGPAGTERIRKAMATIGAQADVIGGQEFSEQSHKDAANAGLGSDFGMVAGDTSHPIWYRKSLFTVTSEQSQQVFTRGTPMEGPDQGTRYVNTVVLHDTTTGQTLTEINFHQLPTIQKGGRLNPDEPKRTAIARDIFAAAMTSARTHMAQGAVTVTADANFDGDPEGMYRAAGLTQASSVFGDLKQATRSRDIDQILFSGGAPTSERIIGAFGSDHSARVVTFPGTTDTASSTADAGVTPAGFNFPGQNTVDQAIAYMSNGHRVRPGTCLHEVGAAYGLNGTTPVAGHFYATGQWDAMPSRYKHADGSTPPRGALVFWHTGNPAGHIAISAGGGQVWTTDPPGHPGTIAKVPISSIDSWGPRLGWSAPFFIGKTHTGGATA